MANNSCDQATIQIHRKANEINNLILSQTLRAVLKFFQANMKVIADELELELVETPSAVKWTSFHPMDSMDGGRTNEAAVALMYRMLTEFLGISDFLISMELAHSPLSDERHYVSYFNVPVVFNAEKTAMRIDPAKLGTKIKYANAELFSHINTHLSLLRMKDASYTVAPELSHLYEAAKANAGLGLFSAECVASTANMSLRSAQRLTAEHGTSIQELIEEIREAMAKECLADDSIHVNSITQMLGYSENRAFRRAFQRWSGQSPSEYRRKLKQSK